MTRSIVMTLSALVLASCSDDPLGTSGDTTTTVADTIDVVAPPDPALAGPLTVTRQQVEVAGFQCLLFVPDDASVHPAIVLAPGFLIDADALVYLGQHLASHGIATLIPTFGDSFLDPISHSALADDIIAMLGWLAADARFDQAHLGVAGHSRGGKAAILATTRSTAIQAAFGLDPVDTPGGPGDPPSAANPSVTPELMARVTVPLGLIGSAYGATPVAEGAPVCAPTDDNYEQYAQAATAAPALYTWVAPASGHNDFGDPLPVLASFACPPGDDPAATRTFAEGRVAAFFLRYLAGDERYTLPCCDARKTAPALPASHFQECYSQCRDIRRASPYTSRARSDSAPSSLTLTVPSR